MTEHETTVVIYSTELEVQFTVSGKHRPATHWKPEEFPELEIISVRVHDLDIEVLELLSEAQLELITEQIEIPEQ